jgi:small subunit ribosomal protein S20
MANTKSALKRVRQTERRTERNRAAKSRIKTLRRKLGDVTSGGKPEEVQAALSELSSVVDKAAKRGVIHRNKADNLKRKAARKAASGSAA